jgi:hypothetical protein
MPNPHHVSGTLSNPRKKRTKKRSRGKEHFRMINTFDYRHTRGRSRSLLVLFSPRSAVSLIRLLLRRCRISEVEQQHSQHRGERNVFLPLLRLAFFPLDRSSLRSSKKQFSACLGCGNGFCFEESEKHLHNHNSKYFDLKKQHFRTNTAALRTSPRHHHDESAPERQKTAKLNEQSHLGPVVLTADGLNPLHEITESAFPSLQREDVN